MKYLKYLLAFLLMLSPAFAAQHTVPSIEDGPWIWQGINIYTPGNLQFTTPISPCPNSPSQEFVEGLSATFEPICGTPTLTVPANSINVPQPVLNASASNVSGSDIGARVNTLLSQLHTAGEYGIVTIDPTQGTSGAYTLSTAINLLRGQTLDCQGAILNWNSSTGEPIIYGDTTSNYITGRIKNCTFVGTSYINSTIGIYAGGDPTATITPSNYYGNFLSIENTLVEGFGTAYTHGNHVWGSDITNSLFFSNNNGIVSSPVGSIDNGEYDHVIDSKIFNNKNCGLYLNNPGDNWIVENSQLDYNVNGTVCGTGASVELNSDWMEQYQGPLVNQTGTSFSNIVKVSGGNMVVTATPYTISNVAIASNVLTLTVTSTVVGYQAGFTYAFSGLTTATFLNGTSGTLISASGSAITLNYTHANYTSASDTGTVTPVSADLMHVEGAFQSYLQMDRVGLNNHGAQTITTPLGVGYNGAFSGARTRVCTINASNGASVYAVTGTVLSGCVYGAPLQQQIGSTFATQSPNNFYYTGAQGWNVAWNIGLNGRSGEMDFVNVHGGGNGGFVWCDGAISFTPGTCQMSLDNSGNLANQGGVTSSGNHTAPQFNYPTVSAGPNGQDYSDFFFIPSSSAGAIGSPSGNSAGLSSAVQDINHPGNLILVSGTVSGSGEYAIGEQGPPWQSLNTTPGWTFDTIVYVPVLPATTAASYEVGLYHTIATIQNSGSGQGFYLSSSNANANHWYCSYGANVNTDSGVAATVAWTHLSMVQNGTNLLWYVNGTQVCSTAIANVTSISSYANWKAVAGSTTSVNFYVDWYVMQRAVTR